MKKKNIYI